MYKVFLLTILSCLSFAEASAAELIPINYGESLTGTIEVTGERHIYTFSGAIGDRLLIRMKGTSGGVDACLALYNAEGEVVAEDCSDGRMAVINNYVLSTGGEYQLHVMDRRDNDTGIYGLSIQLLNGGADAIFQSCEMNFDATLTHLAETDAYSFNADAGDVILVRMKDEEGKVESVIELYSPSGELIERAEPAPDGLTRLGVIGLEEAGEYLLLAMDGNGNDVGNYSFAFQVLNSEECSLPTGCGADFSANLSRKAEIDAYTFQADAGDVIVAHMRGISKDVEARMELYSPDGNLIVTNTNRGRLGLLKPVTLPVSGQYILLAMDDGGNDIGDYALSLQYTNSHVDCAISLDCNSIKETWNLGSTAEIDAFSFYGTANEKLSLTVSDVDPVIEPRFELYAPDGSLVVDASSGSVSSKSNVILPADGSYTLLVMDYEGNDEGRYQIDIISHSFTDAEAPVAACHSELTVQLGVGGTYRLTPEEVDAGSTDNCGIAEMRLDKSEFTCDDMGTQTVTLEVIDESGNSSTCELSLTIEDPTFACGWVYCEAYGESTDFEWIEEVNIGDIQNISGNDNGYGDYTDMTTDLSLGSNEVIELTPSFPNPASPVLECWGVWIDFNNDGDFDDEGEYVVRSSGKSTIYGSIPVPASAVLGETRMRVAMNFEAYPNACDPFGYGEVEDYTVNIVPNAFCGSLPDGWDNADIGEYDEEGTACYQPENSTFVVSSASGDIYGTADDFEFAYQEWCGDGEIIARLTGMTNTSAYDLAGIMFRKKLFTGSKNIALLATPSNGLLFQARGRHHGNTAAAALSGSAPVWLRLKREGKRFTGFTSRNGVDWVANYSVEVNNMGDCIYVGLAVATNNQDENVTFTTASFDNVYVGLSTDDPDEQSNNTGQAGFVKQGPTELTQGITLEDVERDGTARPSNDPLAVTPQAGRSANDFDVNTIQLFPNPTVDYVQVDLRELDAQHIVISIYNTAGQLVLEQGADPKSIVHIDLKQAALSAGQYWVRVRHSDGEISKALVIQPRA